jgi:hypothetical protein
LKDLEAIRSAPKRDLSANAFPLNGWNAVGHIERCVMILLIAGSFSFPPGLRINILLLLNMKFPLLIPELPLSHDHVQSILLRFGNEERELIELEKASNWENENLLKARDERGERKIRKSPIGRDSKKSKETRTSEEKEENYS